MCELFLICCELAAFLIFFHVNFLPLYAISIFVPKSMTSFIRILNTADVKQEMQFVYQSIRGFCTI